MNSQQGDIGFVDNSKFNIVARLIKWFMGSKWTHCFYVLGKINGVIMVIEMSDFHVTIAPLSRYLDGRPVSIIRKENIQEHDKVAMTKPLLSKLGMMYGYLKLVCMAPRRILMKMNIKTRVLIQHEWVCTDVPYTALQEIECSAKGKPQMDTEELYQVLINSKDFKEIYRNGY